jgi:hypothetical protein
MADTDFHDPERISLLTTLKETLYGNVPSTVWACLWLSDIDKLRLLTQCPHLVPLALLNRDITRNLVLLCESITLYTFS